MKYYPESRHHLNRGFDATFRHHPQAQNYHEQDDSYYKTRKECHLILPSYEEEIEFVLIK